MIDWFGHLYPYTNVHELNLDWVIATVKAGEKEIKNFVGLNTIKYADPILWDITRQYETNTVVVDGQTGNAYISVQPVPVGVALSRAEYWTAIFNYGTVVDTLMAQIASNEGLSQTATKSYNVGDLVFFNSLLYRVTAPMIAGDSFVIDSNVVKTTVNDELVSLLASITANAAIVGDLSDLTTSDKVSIVNAINEVNAAITSIGGNVGDLANLNTTDKTNIVNAINELLATIGDLNDLDTTDKTNIVNAINDVLANAGIYNVSTPDSGLTSNIGLKEGVYNVTENLTVNAQMVVPKGAIINVASGVTLTINGSIEAGRYQIFDGGGSIVVNSRLQPFGYPEWFNNNVQKCINTFQETVLGAGDYFVNDNIIINKDNKILRGVGYSGLTDGGFNGSRLVFNSGRLIIGTPNATTTIADFPRHINVRDLEIVTLSNPDDIITMCGNVNGVFENLKLSSSSAVNGIMFYNSITTKLNNIYVQALPVKTGVFYAFRFTDTYGSVAGERSASVWITNSIFNDTRAENDYGFGFWLEGAISDVFIDHCEVIRGYNAVTLKNLGNDAVNIRITNCDFDQQYGHGLEISGASNTNCAVTFDGNYIALQGGTTNALVYLEVNVPCTMNGVQLIGTNASQNAIQSPVSPSLIGNGIVRGITTPINVAGTTNMSFKYLKNGALV